MVRAALAAGPNAAWKQ